MEEWKTYRLGDVCKILGRIGFRGYTVDDLVEDAGKGAVSLSPTNLIGGVLDLSKPTYISWEKYYESPEIMIEEGDVVIVKTGSSVGRTAMIRNLSHPMTLNPQLVVLKDVVINRKFLGYLVKSRDFQGKLASIVVGSAIPTLSQKNLANLTIQVPSIATQERIAGILSAIDDKIELNNRINHNLEEQAQALYKSWFVDFEPFKDGEFVESEQGMIPKGWKVVNLDSLCSIISRGFSPKYSVFTTDIVLGQRCVRNNMIDLSVSRTHVPKNLGIRALCQYDILINSTGMGSLGRVAQIYFKPTRMTYDSHLTLVRSNSSILEMYIGRNLLSRQDEIENMAVGSTGQTELPRDSVKAMRILLPCDTVLEQFGVSLRAIVGRIQCNLEENSDLTTMRDHLLPKLMTGELNINEIDC